MPVKCPFLASRVSVRLNDRFPSLIRRDHCSCNLTKERVQEQGTKQQLKLEKMPAFLHLEEKTYRKWVESEHCVGSDSIVAGVNTRIREEAFHRIGVVFEELQRQGSMPLPRRDTGKMAGIHMDETNMNNAAAVDATWVSLDPSSLPTPDDDTEVDHEVGSKGHDIVKRKAVTIHIRADLA